LEREKSEENNYMKEEISGKKIGVFYCLVGELRRKKIRGKVVGTRAHKNFPTQIRQK
jgi:hypothetical protein